jgi:tripartite-type tricarboxylate transporter receptor subunit TctC
MKILKNTKNMAARALLVVAASATLPIGTQTFAADAAYPIKPITIVVPFNSGGPSDLLARTLAGVMSKNLGQEVKVENIGGDGGTKGVGVVTLAPKDGYTALVTHIGIATAPALYLNLRYNAINDLEPIGLLAEVPMTVIAKPTMAADNLKDFLVFAKENKDKLSYAHAGVGSASHLCGMLLLSAINADILTIPHKGTKPAMDALLAGKVDFMCDQTTNTTDKINAKAVKAYAVTTKTRLSALPDLPTLEESGMKGVTVGVWHGLWVPKGTPNAAAKRLNAAMQVALSDATVIAELAKLSTKPYPVAQQTPTALRALHKSETAKWAPIIKKAAVFAD